MRKHVYSNSMPERKEFWFVLFTSCTLNFQAILSDSAGDLGDYLFNVSTFQ